MQGEGGIGEISKAGALRAAVQFVYILAVEKSFPGSLLDIASRRGTGERFFLAACTQNP